MPKGYGKSIGQVNAKVRSAVVSALRILDDQGTPLKMLLVKAFRDDPVRTLGAVARFLPTEARVEVVDVARLHLQAVQAMGSVPVRSQPPMLDITPQHLPMRDTTRSDAELIEELLS